MEVNMRRLYFSKRRAWMVPLTLAASLFLTAQAPPPEPVTDQETELGDAVYKDLKGKASIIAKSPLYDSIKPVTTTITRVAQPRYEHPFKFYLVHDPRANAFSVPGGAIYVTDALVYFVKNTEELTAVLCHETSHTIHHDAMNRIREMEKAYAGAIGVTLLLGPTLANVIAAKFVTDLYKNAYSRDLETRADLTGSDTCAAAGYNPYGMIWLMEDFKEANPEQGPQLLADHPSHESRIQALQTHFRENPGVFSKFSSDRKLGTPFSVPEDAPVVFLRQ
jgi:beta-barrel assembly-enhancing protease